MSSFPRGYAEKCFDFDCIKVDQLILISRGTQRRFPPNCIGNTFWAMQSAFRSQKCIESGTKIFISVQSSYGNLSLF